MQTFKKYFLTESKVETIAVDLDGTLAHYTHYKAGHIGQPISKMMERVKNWLKEGKNVIIFTARADQQKEVKAIKKWLKENDLPDLKITNKKTPDITQFWDDRAIGVEKNTGQVIGTSDSIDAMNESLMKKALPFIAAGLTGLGGTTHADVATNAVSQPANFRIHRKSAHEIDREIKYRAYLDSINKAKKPISAPAVKQNVTKQASIKAKKSPITNFKVLIPAIAKKETGHLNPSERDKAIGDNGKAFGRYQVHEGAVKDVNRVYGTHYKHKDMFNPRKAEDVLIKYLTFWGKFNKKHKGIEPSVKNLAAMWNGGGPSGFKNYKALHYATDVLSNMYVSN